MSNEVRAVTQYGDMRGTISIDGWDGVSLIGIGAVAGKGYLPVAIEFYGESQIRRGKHHFNCYVLAVDESILDKSAPDGLKSYIREHGELPVFRFRSSVKLEKVIPLLKRISIVLQGHLTGNVPLVRVGDDSIYGNQVNEDVDGESEEDGDGE
jgi:hypothetical protein